MAPLLMATSPAQAESGAMVTPVTSTLITGIHGHHCGYNDTHRGTDFAAPSGRQVYAAYDGHVDLRSGSSGYGTHIVLSHPNGYSTLYGHLSGYAVGEGQHVARGTVIGYVGSTGDSSGPHLHFEIRRNGASLNVLNSQFPCRATSTALAPITWSPDLPASSTPPPTAPPPPAPAPIAPRIGILDGAGTFFAKDGGLDAPWVNTSGGGTAMAVDGDRIGMIDGAGNLWVKDGGLSSAWFNVHPGVAAFSLSGDRIGIVTTGGDAYLQDGSLSGAWQFLAHDADNITLAAERIGLIDGSGIVFVKEGSPDAPWTTQAHDVRQLVMTDSRIGIVTEDDVAFVKEGDLYAPWVEQSGSIVQMSISGNRIAVLDTNTIAHVRDGGLQSPWTQMGNQISRVEVTATRVGIIRNGEAWVKEGDLNGAWHVMAHNVTGLSLS